MQHLLLRTPQSGSNTRQQMRLPSVVRINTRAACRRHATPARRRAVPAASIPPVRGSMATP
jgi:hypothetical protein